MEVVTGDVLRLPHLFPPSLPLYGVPTGFRIWELQGEGNGVAVGATEALRYHQCAQQSSTRMYVCMCMCVYAWVRASDWALEGLGKAGLQGPLLELSLPKYLGSLSRSRAR